MFAIRNKVFPTLCVLLLLVSVSTHAFLAAPVVVSLHRPAATFLCASTDFETYEQTESQQLAMLDSVVGTGQEIAKGNLCTVKYEGRFMASGEKFDESEGYVFKFGEGKVLPGWEKGLAGMKIGGKRTLRIPPSLAYGDQWFKGTIPPKSHLEFDCELIKIANGPVEELVTKLQAFGVARAATLVVLITFLAISPMLG